MQLHKDAKESVLLHPPFGLRTRNTQHRGGFQGLEVVVIDTQASNIG
jgi:hypothetical protein